MKELILLSLFIVFAYKVSTYERSESKQDKQISYVEPTKFEVDHPELEVLAKIVSGEAIGESYKGKVAVANVVLNRVNSKDFPNTITKVIYQRGQFDGVRSDHFDNPTKDCYKAAREALKGKSITDAVYYANVVTATDQRWVRKISKLAKKTKDIGRHTFYSI